MRKVFLAAAMLLFSVSGLIAQNTVAHPADSTYYNPQLWGGGGEVEAQNQEEANKVRYNVQMNGYVGGNSYGSHSGFGVTPSATIPVSRKMDLTVGVDVNQMYYSGSALIRPDGVSGENIPRVRSQHTNAVLFAQGTYYVNDRWTVWGSVYANMNPNVPQNMPVWGTPGKGVTVGAEYKISEKSRIGFQFSYSEGMPYYGPGSMGMGFSPYGFTGGMGGFGYPRYGRGFYPGYRY